jgi:hypothetical protein
MDRDLWTWFCSFRSIKLYFIRYFDLYLGSEFCSLSPTQTDSLLLHKLVHYDFIHCTCNTILVLYFLDNSDDLRLTSNTFCYLSQDTLLCCELIDREEFRCKWLEEADVWQVISIRELWTIYSERIYEWSFRRQHRVVDSWRKRIVFKFDGQHSDCWFWILHHRKRYFTQT